MWRHRQDRHQSRQAGLSADQLADRLPADIRSTTERWPFQKLPLHLPDSALSGGDMRLSTPGSVLRFGGVMTSLDLEGSTAVIRPYDPPGQGHVHFAFNTLIAKHPERYAALSGLIIDLALRVEEEPDLSPYYRSATLATIYGIERPVVLGDREGLLRGEITDLERNEFNEDIYGCQVKGEGQRVFTVQCNPSDEKDPTIWSEGNVVGLRVMRGGPSGSFMQDRSPVPPLRHSVLLQAAG